MVAAVLAGLTRTGYVAKCATDVAAARVRPAPTSMVDAIGELLQARHQVQKFSVLVNQAMAKWHSTDQLPPQLLRAVALVVRVLNCLEEAAGAVKDAQQDVRRRRRSIARAAAKRPDQPPPHPASQRSLDAFRPGRRPGDANRAHLGPRFHRRKSALQTRHTSCIPVNGRWGAHRRGELRSRLTGTRAPGQCEAVGVKKRTMSSRAVGDRISFSIRALSRSIGSIRSRICAS
jgi:hypothetical protein